MFFVKGGFDVDQCGLPIMRYLKYGLIWAVLWAVALFFGAGFLGDWLYTAPIESDSPGNGLAAMFLAVIGGFLGGFLGLIAGLVYAWGTDTDRPQKTNRRRPWHSVSSDMSNMSDTSDKSDTSDS